MSIKIDGVTYNIPVVSLTRRAEFLDKFAERTADGVLKRELIGVYFNYEITLGQVTDVAEYASLWAALTEATDFHTVTVPDEDGENYSFVAYFSSITDTLRKIKDGQPYWKQLKVHFIAKSPVT